MGLADVDPARFFDAFDRFVETSATGPARERLNARFLALVHSQRDLLTGARVLDLASHDGRFSFAALHCGAEYVTGIEHDPALVRAAAENLAHYGAPSDRYEFLLGDLVDQMDRVERCDVVFCFGILYHLMDHMRLLSRIAELEPRHLLIDTHLSRLDGAVVELRNAFGESPPPPGSFLEGYPTRAALEAMVSHFGWTYHYVDWDRPELLGSTEVPDYRSGKRVTMVVRCGDGPIDPERREAAVAAVLAERTGRRTQWRTIRDVAARSGIGPEILRFWVAHAERDPERGGHHQPSAGRSGR